MSIANWNPIAFYVVGDEVYDLSADYYVALANNTNDPPPSANWALIPPPVGGITTITTPNGSGMNAVVALPNAQLSTNLLPGPGITITPSGINTSITIGTSTVSFPPSYGSFYSTATQTLNPVAPAKENLVTYNNTFLNTPDIVLFGALPTSVIQVNTAGVYKFLYSIQCNKNPGGATSFPVDIYIKVNGLVVPNSTSRTRVTNNTEVVATCEYILNLAATNTIEVAAYTTALGLVDFPYFAPTGTAPATPSIISNIYRIA